MKPCMVIIAAGLSASSGVAAAQSHPEAGVFVQAGAFAGIERLPHVSGPGVLGGLVGLEQNTNLEAFVSSSDPSGTVAGGTFGVGVFLRPFLTLRTEAALSSSLEEDFQLRSGSLLPISLSTRTSLQAQDVYVLLGYETAANRRVRLSYLGGATLHRQRQHHVSGFGLQFSPGFPLTIPSPIELIETTTVSYHVGLVVGLDAQIALSDHAALVPHVRVVVVADALSLRPGINLRWAF